MESPTFDFSPKVLEFTKKVSGHLLPGDDRCTIYNQLVSSSVGTRQMLCLAFVQPSFIGTFFFQLIVIHCASHCSGCFMWLETE